MVGYPPVITPRDFTFQRMNSMMKPISVHGRILLTVKTGPPALRAEIVVESMLVLPQGQVRDGIVNFEDRGPLVR